MPVDFQQIQARIEQIGARELGRSQELEKRKRHALELLSAHAHDLDALRAKAERANSTDPSTRCAVPVDEPLTSSHPCPPIAEDATLIAVDGSQINPSRHEALQFGVVNVGAVIMKMHSGEAPLICTDTNLIYGEDLETEYGTISEQIIALRRDVKEREILEQLANDVSGRVVTFTDGPIELWGTTGEEAKEFARALEDYRRVLSRLQARGVITAGYVVKPSADLVVRLLELATMSDDELEDLQTLRTRHPFRGVSDRLLYTGYQQPLIFPGHRSAVFRLQSSSQNIYTGTLTLHFFYLNVGTVGHPSLVRVDIPQWVADDPAKLDLLHAVLVEQCGIMGYAPYPYLLHRAHETAVVRREERGQIEHLLMLELIRHGEPLPEKSSKQSAKDLPGRKSI